MGNIDYGYPWWLGYGHLVVCAVGLLFLLAGVKWRWNRWAMLAPGALVLWSFAAFLVMHSVLDINGAAAMPTQAFLANGAGKVLDLGAGTGRSSIMVLQARPRATLTALDLFGDSYGAHFGSPETGEQRLLANLKTAGVAERASIVKHDMRELPYEAASFDAIVSAYAVDHLRRQGIEQTLREAARVIKPGGDFLLILIGKDRWVQFAFGPLAMHMGARDGRWWSARMEEAGFQVSEQGMRPATLYLLGKKR